MTDKERLDEIFLLATRAHQYGSLGYVGDTNEPTSQITNVSLKFKSLEHEHSLIQEKLHLSYGL